ncbi:hypothetical protein TNCV_1312041 [Trichonephila clavipes]|nr:hypothetical protein TNCV_1312041 [Trichonephila clavipes]
MNYKESIQSKNDEIKWKLNPLPYSLQPTAANITKTTPGGHKICDGKADVYKSYGESTKGLWDKENGRNNFVRQYPSKHFALCRELFARLDTKPTRQERIKLDEQLVEIRGQYPFKQYISRQLLLKREMTMLATIRINKPELPEETSNKEAHRHKPKKTHQL